MGYFVGFENPAFHPDLRTVLPAPSNRVGPNGTALCVTQSRDPRSQVIGWLYLGRRLDFLTKIGDLGSNSRNTMV